jgi:hypothetical protein
MLATRNESPRFRLFAVGITGAVVGVAVGWFAAQCGEKFGVDIVEMVAECLGGNVREDWFGSIAAFTVLWAVFGCATSVALWMLKSDSSGQEEGGRQNGADRA